MIFDVIFASWQKQQGGTKSSDPAPSITYSDSQALCFSLQHLALLAEFKEDLLSSI